MIKYTNILKCRQGAKVYHRICFKTLFVNIIFNQTMCPVNSPKTASLNSLLHDVIVFSPAKKEKYNVVSKDIHIFEPDNVLCFGNVCLLSIFDDIDSLVLKFDC